MTDSSPGMPEFGPEDTFNRLRRAPYLDAVVEYSMACLYLRSDASQNERVEVAGPALAKLGWTVTSLFNESRRLSKIEREKDEPNKRNVY